MEHWWNDSDWGKLKYLEKTLSLCYFVYPKFQRVTARTTLQPWCYSGYGGDGGSSGGFGGS